MAFWAVLEGLVTASLAVAATALRSLLGSLVLAGGCGTCPILEVLIYNLFISMDLLEGFYLLVKLTVSMLAYSRAPGL